MSPSASGSESPLRRSRSRSKSASAGARSPARGCRSRSGSPPAAGGDQEDLGPKLIKKGKKKKKKEAKGKDEAGESQAPEANKDGGSRPASASPPKKRKKARKDKTSQADGSGDREGSRPKKKTRKKKKKGSEAKDSSDAKSEVEEAEERAASKPKKKRKKAKKAKKEGSEDAKNKDDEEAASDAGDDGDGDGSKKKKRRKSKSGERHKGRRRRRRKRGKDDDSDGKDSKAKGADKDGDVSGDDKEAKSDAEDGKDGDDEEKKKASEDEDDSSSQSGSKAADKKEGHGRRRKRRRRAGSGSPHRKRRRRRRDRSGSRGRSRGKRGRSGGGNKDRRPMVERVKGGVKLFVGRLPLEATQSMLKDCFKEFGEVLEVFLIDSKSASAGARCAFVRVGSLEAAEKAIDEMHEQRVLVPDRKELGPIQVAFAKGEATRFGLDAAKEQLPARWQVPQGKAESAGPAAGPPAAGQAVDPDSLSKDALVSLVKEGQRTGGQPFKHAWWGYCDSGKGDVRDYDPKRHSRSSLRQFYIAAQQGEWGSKAWFRRATNWALMGGRNRSAPRGRRRRRRRGSGSSSSSSSRSSSSSSSRSQPAKAAQVGIDASKAAAAVLQAGGILPQGVMPPPGPLFGAAAARPAGTPLQDMLRGAQPPLPEAPPPPEPEAPKPSRLLASAAERDPELEAFLTRHRISPSTSFLMLKLTAEQASRVMSTVNFQLLSKAGEPSAGREAEDACVAQLKELGIRTSSSGGGAWTSIERSGSPLKVRSQGKADAEEPPPSPPPPPPSEGGLDALSALPDLDGLLGKELTAPLPKVAGEGDDDAEADGKDSSPADKASRLRTHDRAEVGADTMDAAGGARVFVKNLDKGTGGRDLRDLFGKHGTVVEVEIPRDKDGSSKGCAFVKMRSPEEGERCVKKLHFTKPFGRALIVERLLKSSDDAGQPADLGQEVNGKAKDGDGKKTRKKADKKGRKSNDSDASDRSSDDESGWSRYTVGSRNRKAKPKKKDKRKEQEKKKDSDSDYDDSSYSEDDEYSEYSSGDDSRDSGAPRGPVMPMGWPGPGMPGMPPGMMPPPWAVPPWGMPGMMDESSFPVYDRDEAERQLARAERAAKKGDKGDSRGRDDKKKDKWDDHPARRGGGKPSRSPSRIPQRARSSSSRSSRGSRRDRSSSRGRRRSPSRRRRKGSSRSPPPPQMYGPPGIMPGPGGKGAWPTMPPHMMGPRGPSGYPAGWAGHPMGPAGYRGMPPNMRPPPGPPPGPPPCSAAPQPRQGKVEQVDSDGSDVDVAKMQDEINFGDI